MDRRLGTDDMIDPVPPSTGLDDSGAPPASRTARDVLRIVALAALGLVAAAAFLASGILILLSVGLTPNPGNEALLFVMKVFDVVVWLAIGWWLVVDWWRPRLRVVVPAVIAWAWAYLMAGALSGLGFLNIGY